MKIPAENLENALLCNSFWPNRYSEVSRSLSDKDYMIEFEQDVPNFEHYLTVAFEAADLILRLTGNTTFERILDYGSGYGRVTRALRCIYPNSQIFCIDNDLSGPIFCSDFLGSNLVENLSELEDSSIDLIWLGSVITHLSELNTLNLFAQLTRVVKLNGYVIYSSHGDFVSARLRKFPHLYGLGELAATKLLTQFEADGYGYENYPNWEDYGISIVSEGSHKKLIDSSLYGNFQLIQTAWDGHHDVISIQRVK